MHDTEIIPHHFNYRHVVVYFVIGLALLLLCLLLGRLEPVRVGDGSEYYALYLAWRDTLRPWMGGASYASYQQLFSEHGIAELVTLDWLRNAFPSLHLGETADFNHFWFYSFLAFIVSKVASFIGLMLNPHQAFLALHWLLLFATCSTAYRLYGGRGVAVFVILTFCSPIIWFVDKVHTELLTYCATLIGIMLVFSRMYLAAAFAIAIAATQNPSFALVAFIPFTYRFILFRTQRFTLIEVCIVVATVLMVLVHPVYYFLRYGVVTPQLLAGGASLGRNLSTFYIWILDPDLGLLPNWPVGVFIIGTALILLRRKPLIASREGRKPFYIFLAAFFFINFYAHSSTINLNSAGTPGVARYSLWYLPAFFPIVYFVARCLPFRNWVTALWVIVLLVLGIYSARENNPVRHEQYSVPSWLSNMIQTDFPNLYFPPDEVFVERYSGYGEAIYSLRPRAILGPDCHKLFIFGGQRNQMVTAPSSCALDLMKLEQTIATEFPITEKDRYVRLSDNQLKSAILVMKFGHYPAGPSDGGSPMLGAGWLDVEPWGRWSTTDATLTLPCNPAQPYAARSSVDLILHVQSFANQPVQIRQDDIVLFDGPVPTDNLIPVQLQVEGCKVPFLTLGLHIKNAKSPRERGLSEDTRILGIGLRGIDVLP